MNIKRVKVVYIILQSYTDLSILLNNYEISSELNQIFIVNLWHENHIFPNLISAIILISLTKPKVKLWNS